MTDYDDHDLDPSGGWPADQWADDPGVPQPQGPQGWQQPGPAGPPLGRGGPPRPNPRPGGAGGGGGGGARFANGSRGGGARGGVGRGPRLLLGTAVVGLLLAGAFGIWVQRKIDPSGSPGEVQTITIAPGSTTSSIGRQLVDEGVISSSFVWDWYLRINGGGPFEAGEYELADNSSMGDVVRLLQRGPKPPDELRFTIAEGLTLKETLGKLADPDKGLGLDLATMEELLSSGQVRSTVLGADVTSAEGILFPETYQVARDADAKTVLEKMVAQLDSTLTELDVSSAMEQFHLTPYEILITASLIEEETKVPEERAMVARVIYNRLKQGIPLGIDATSRYEAELAGRSRNSIDFSSSSPFNTRKVKGLPPTPIAAPGRASIEAALHPDDGTWIYYVASDAQGHHLFTDSASEFAQAKQRCHDAGLGCG